MSPRELDRYEGPIRRSNLRHARRRAQLHAHALRSPQQRLEHIARAVGVGEELAPRLAVQRDTDVGEEPDSGWNGEVPEHPAHDGRAAAVEVALADRLVGDVAARAAADEDLGADAGRAVEKDDGPIRSQLSGENGRGETGGPGAHDGDAGALRRQPRPSCVAGPHQPSF